MELHRIIISELRDQQMVYLREIEGPRRFPILIGLFEALSIQRRVRNDPAPRPPTHALIKNVIEELGAEAQDVVINDLVDHTYFATLRLRRDGELIQIDSRPSDAIAIAVQYSPPLPIYVEQSVLDVVSEES